MPWIAIRRVGWLSWVSVRGWQLYRDDRGRLCLVHRNTGRVRRLGIRRPGCHRAA
ncbi:MAG TPA: hypothetical protein VIK73_09660 [Limnochordales bacterium]